MTFKNGNEMLKTLKTGVNLYNPEREMYVYATDDIGSICFRRILRGEADFLTKKYGSRWGASLGTGGKRYEDKKSETYEASKTSNIDFCNKNYKGEWFDTEELVKAA